jgi:predicted nucleotidyltransferase
MAKQQSFADKAKAKKRESGVTVKLIRTVKTEKGTYKFNERFVKIDDISKVGEIK